MFKLGFWVFIGSETLLFGTLISTYMIYRGESVTGPFPKDIFSIPLTTFSAFVLLMSSLTMVLALAAVKRGDRKLGMRWLLTTAALGSVFLGFQAYEFTHFAAEGLTMGSNLFGSTFYLMTGFHGAHVSIGVFWLLALWLEGLRGGLGQDSAVRVEVCGLYWHFVDIVWIAIFTFVYLFEV